MPKTFTQSLAAFVPKWLSWRVQNTVAFKVLWVVAFQVDLLCEQAVQGVLAAWPGKGTPTALPMIGQSRGIPQGPNEGNAAYALHLQQWRTIGQNSGSDEVLVQEIQRYLTPATGPLLTVQVVSRSGMTVTAHPDGSITTSTRAWNWDGVTGWDDGSRVNTPAAMSGWWSDQWILIAPDPFAHYTTFDTDANWQAAWGGALDAALDHLAPSATVSGLLSVIADKKGAHIFVRAIVFCADVTALSPDGTFGNDVVIHPYNAAAVDARDLTASYWEPYAGG